jgi:hypothetical protein
MTAAAARVRAGLVRLIPQPPPSSVVLWPTVLPFKVRLAPRSLTMPPPKVVAWPRVHHLHVIGV